MIVRSRALKERYDLKSVTFLITLQTESSFDLENLTFVLKFITENFVTNVIVTEIGIERKFFYKTTSSNYRYFFYEINNPIFYNTFFIHQAISKVKTPVLSIWDSNVIVHPSQVINSTELILNDPKKLIVPYNKIIDGISTKMMKKGIEVNQPEGSLSTENKPSLHFYGLSTMNGVIFINKDEYLKYGGENPNIIFEPGNSPERLKRLEILGLKKIVLDAPVFILAQSKKSNNYSDHILKNNLQEFIRICSMNKSNLEQYVSNWTMPTDLNEHIFNMQKRIYNKQKKDLNNLYKTLKSANAFPFDFIWSVHPDFLKVLIDRIDSLKPKNIFECGSGLSTIVNGYLAKDIRGHVFSLEHDKIYYEKTKSYLKTHKLEKYVTLIHAPLKKYILNKQKWLWYDTNKLPQSLDFIDFLIVDGPPGFIQKKSRYPAVPLLKNLFCDKIQIIVDDYKREDDKETIDSWLEEYPDLRSEYIDTKKGCFIINKRI